jgi:hypothetical protein
MPVERIIGLPVRAMVSTRGRSLSSNEATLWQGTPSFSRKATAVGSNGVEKHSRPRAFAASMSSACHSQGVIASA